MPRHADPPWCLVIPEPRIDDAYTDADLDIARVAREADLVQFLRTTGLPMADARQHFAGIFYEQHPLFDYFPRARP